jgi:uncharacterized membrane protein (DUF2068 family)
VTQVIVPTAPAGPRRSRRILDLIAAFKFVKAATLVAAGLAGFGLLDAPIERWAELWLERLALGGGPAFVSGLAARMLPSLVTTSEHRIVLLSLGAIAYAAVFVVEGYGLIRERRWAEYLTIAVTVSFIPFEVVALMHKESWPRSLTLAANVLVVGYLVWRVRTDRQIAA